MKTPAAAPVSSARREIVGPAVDLACPELFVMIGLLIRRDSSKPQALIRIARRSYSGGEGSSRAAGAPPPPPQSQLSGARPPPGGGPPPWGRRAGRAALRGAAPRPPTRPRIP